MVQLDILKSGIAHITLGTDAEKNIVLTQERLKQFEAVISQVIDLKPKGLIITGNSNDMFSVGADIHAIQGVTDKAVGAKLAYQGQKIFDKIATLPFGSVAAISGPCVGGGFEMALACTYRICTDSPKTLIGLPEIKLGIIPGFGGTQRLPKLIGLPKALEIILSGKTLRSSQAKETGLVNEIVSHEKLLGRSEEILLNDPLKKKDLSYLDAFLTNSNLGRSIVKKRALKNIQKQTKGFYPAPEAALKSCIYGLENGMNLGFEFEAKELGKMIVTPQSKALVKVYFLTEMAKSLGKSAKGQLSNMHAAVVGAGVMGSGIATLLLKNGYTVKLYDAFQPALEKAQRNIQNSLQKLGYIKDSDREAMLLRLSTEDVKYISLQDTGLVIEAAIEELSLKKEIFHSMASKGSPNTVYATNTSSISITAIADEAQYSEQIVGTHFFNPVEKMPLVEIIRGKKTSDKCVVISAAIANKLGKFPIIVNDVPGFLVNRILVPFLNSAAILLSDGYAIEDIEAAALQFGMPMGPFRLLDEVGLDVAAKVAKIMKESYGKRMDAPAYAELLTSKGKLGKKSGSGFYEFKDKKAKLNKNIKSILQISKPAKSYTSKEFITNALIYSMVNEAVRCLDEGVAGQPGREAAGQIDLGSVMGFGFPPFRGGLLFYADTVGNKEILKGLYELSSIYGDLFVPSEGLQRRAEEGIKFH
jgi:3-hydroxyacyl-CoA dehydrogenase / enoyl-CoA hydratase / 3-hydroxybutyryl-CoA epimerase